MAGVEKPKTRKNTTEKPYSQTLNYPWHWTFQFSNHSPGVTDFEFTLGTQMTRFLLETTLELVLSAKCYNTFKNLSPRSLLKIGLWPGTDANMAKSCISVPGYLLLSL